jgi:hypothetical protein
MFKSSHSYLPDQLVEFLSIYELHVFRSRICLETRISYLLENICFKICMLFLLCFYCELYFTSLRVKLSRVLVSPAMFLFRRNSRKTPGKAAEPKKMSWIEWTMVNQKSWPSDMHVPSYASVVNCAVYMESLPSKEGLEEMCRFKLLKFVRLRAVPQKDGSWRDQGFIL